MKTPGGIFRLQTGPAPAILVPGSVQGVVEMQGIGWLAALVIGGLAGWIAARFMGANTGILLNIVLGIVGAMVANVLFRLIGLAPSATWIAQGFVGFVGACILIAGWRMVRGR